MERYEKLRVIGQGAYGKVFLCRKVVDKSLLVLKQVPLDELQKDDRRAALNEVTVLSRLKHPNIIAYIDNFVEEKSLMIAMEYAPGGTLYDFIMDRNGVLLVEEHILQIFAQILVAIEHIHSQNILHRDLKPQNIMLNKKRTVVKLGDFGISKVLSTMSVAAQTVVGTPCYISPEICEGRLYAKKSDIWALGCILYELTTLKKAFEGPSLPALVIRIMQASAALEPIDSRYSKGLRDLIASLMQKTPRDRPSVENIMALPVVINALLNLCTDIGRLPCTRLSEPSATADSGTRRSDGKGGVWSRPGSLKSCRQRSFFEDDYHPPGLKPGHKGSHKPQAYLWGGGVAIPTSLPAASDSKISDVAVGRSQRAAITEDGKLIFWELSSGSMTSTRLSSQPQARKKESAVFVLQPVAGLFTTVIKKVACGDMFTACLTDKGILMTFGSGVSGCLGHGDFSDAAEPRLVQTMLAHQTLEVACGPNHVIAVTAGDAETPAAVFAWGKGSSGQLGLGDHSSHASPQEVAIPEGCVPKMACCGPDCSLVVTEQGQVLATGSNRYNKLALDVEGKSLGAVEEASKMEAERQVTPSTSQTPRFQEPTAIVPSGTVSPIREREDTPAILSLIKDPPSLMGSSFILSTIHAKKMASKTGGEAHSDRRPVAGLRMGGTGRGGGGRERGEVTRMERQNRVGTVDEVLRFQASGSGLLSVKKVISLSSGTNHTAFLTDANECITCGDNGCGQLGYRREKGARNPSPVTALAGKVVERVACGDLFTIACTSGGEVYSWGRGKRGRLGRETEEDLFEPQPITFESSHSVQSVACSHGVTILLSVAKS